MNDIVVIFNELKKAKTNSDVSFKSQELAREIGRFLDFNQAKSLQKALNNYIKQQSSKVN